MANKLVTISNPQNNAAVNRLLQGVFDRVPTKLGTQSFVDELGSVTIERGRVSKQATAGTTSLQNTIGNEPDITPRSDGVPSFDSSTTTTTEQPLATKQGDDPSNDGSQLALRLVLVPKKVINCISPVLGVGSASSTPLLQQQQKYGQGKLALSRVRLACCQESGLLEGWHTYTLNRAVSCCYMYRSRMSYRPCKLPCLLVPTCADSKAAKRPT